MEQLLLISKILVLVACLWFSLANSTLYPVGGGPAQNRRIQRCWAIPNCQLCTDYDCLRCNRGYVRILQDVGIRCVRTCPRGQVVVNGMCALRYRECPYGVPYCEKCTNSVSCERCISGYIGLRQGTTRLSPYSCVKRCPQNWRSESVRGYGQRCIPQPTTSPSACRMVGNCMDCQSVSKCLTCKSGYRLRVDFRNRDLTCVLADRVSCGVDDRGCLSCSDSRPVRCYKCQKNYKPALGPNGQSVVCNPIQVVPTTCRVDGRGCLYCSDGRSVQCYTCQKNYRPALGPDKQSVVCLPKQAPVRRGCDYVSCRSTSLATCVVQNGKLLWSCSTRSDPVCGSNGHTYSNACFLKLHTCTPGAPYVYLAYRGTCGTAAPPIRNPCNPNPCRRPYAVCVVKQGSAKCRCDKICDKEDKKLRPVCGSDGITYSNKCYVKKRSCTSNRQITVAYSGNCRAVGPCREFQCNAPYSRCIVVRGRPTCRCDSCSSVNQPVCGSDKVTYDNICKLKREACLTITKITVASQGICSDPCASRRCQAPYAVCKVEQGRPVCRCNTDCPDVRDPVCGSNYKNYTNRCLMELDSCQNGIPIRVRSEGVCPDPCARKPCTAPYSRCKPSRAEAICSCPRCRRQYQPVCGSDGQTYNNLCYLRLSACQSNAMIRSEYTGRCRDACAEKTCPDPYAVCVSIRGRARCECPNGCPSTTSEVCGSDFNTYSNLCVMKRTSCTTKTMINFRSIGRCPDPCRAFPCPAPHAICRSSGNRRFCSCETNCPLSVSKVCGTDSRTYNNQCLMKLQACQTNALIAVRSQGACIDPCEPNPCRAPYAICRAVGFRADCSCSFNCSERVDFVCGSDGRTYNNECKLRINACRLNRNIRVAARGRCRDPCDAVDACKAPYSICTSVQSRAVCSCPTCPDGRPVSKVCGSNKKTYQSACHLRRDSCNTNVVITVQSQGECRGPCSPNPCKRPYALCSEVNGRSSCDCPRFCPRIYKPVCGTDGRTYGSQCLLTSKSCEKNTWIYVATTGVCPDVCRGNPCRDRPYSVCREVDGRAACECRKNCPEDRNPVCGSDGNTYGNECLMRRRACESRTRIVVRSRGECQADLCAGNPCASRKPYSNCTVVDGRVVCKCLQQCLPVQQPVCGSDGRTYSNLCLMEREACRSKRLIRKAYDGICRGINPCAGNPCAGRPYSTCVVIDGRALCECRKNCPSRRNPVCGSDGRTYDNECLLRQNACNNRRNITIVTQGACGSPVRNPCDNNPCAGRPYSFCRIHKGIAGCACVDNCSDAYNPVCGTDDKTYNNECYLRRQACRSNVMIRVKFSRACQGSCQLIGNCLVCNGQKPRKCTECPEGFFVELSSDGRTLNCRKQQANATLAPTLSCRFVDSCWVCAGSKKRKCAVCPTGYVAEPKAGEKHTIQCVRNSPQASSLPDGCLDLACKTCRVGWYNLDFNGHSCYRECPQGYYPSGRICAKCPDGCEICYTSKTCYRCKANLARLYNAALGVQCVRRCPRDYRRELIKGTLVCTSSLCEVENCIRCSGSPKLCDKCDVDFYKFFSVRTGEDRCLAYCPNGFRARRAENGGFICSPGINYILQDRALQSCNQVCQSRSLECAPDDHGFTNNNILTLFRQLGVSCTTGFADSDNYRRNDNPLFIKRSARNEGFAGRCVGWKNIPRRINCAAASTKPSAQRLCPCREKETGTPPPTQAPRTEAATEPYITPIWVFNKL